MGERKPEITFQLTSVEALSADERENVEGLDKNSKSGLVIKEYKSGSFVKLRRFIPKDNSFISHLKDGLEVDDRKKITAHINRMYPRRNA